jgi:hypothetical protein
VDVEGTRDPPIYHIDFYSSSAKIYQDMQKLDRSIGEETESQDVVRIIYTADKEQAPPFTSKSIVGIVSPTSSSTATIPPSIPLLASCTPQSVGIRHQSDQQLAAAAPQVSNSVAAFILSLFGVKRKK